MNKNIENNFVNKNETTEFNKDWYLSMLNFCDNSSSDDNNKSKDDLLWKLYTLLFLFAHQPQNNVILEKEVAYLHGEIDTLKEIIFNKKMEQNPNNDSMLDLMYGK